MLAIRRPPTRDDLTFQCISGELSPLARPRIPNEESCGPGTIGRREDTIIAGNRRECASTNATAWPIPQFGDGLASTSVERQKIRVQACGTFGRANHQEISIGGETVSHNDADRLMDLSCRSKPAIGETLQKIHFEALRRCGHKREEIPCTAESQAKRGIWWHMGSD